MILENIKKKLVKNAEENLDGMQDLVLGSEEHKTAEDINDKEIRTVLEIYKVERQFEEQKIKQEMEYNFKLQELECKHKEQIAKAIATGVVGVAGVGAFVGVGWVYLFCDVNGYLPSKFLSSMMDKTTKFLVRM